MRTSFLCVASISLLACGPSGGAPSTSGTGGATGSGGAAPACQGSITYGVATPYMAGSSLGDFVAADLNGDGKLDLALIDNGADSVEVLFNEGKRKFFPPAGIPAGQYPVQIAAGQLHPGSPGADLVVANEGDGSVSVFLNAGFGTFKGSGVVVGTSPSSVALADMNSDGHLDVVVYDAGGGTIDWLENHGDGTFAPVATLASGLASVGHIVVKDLNDDGRPDVAFASCGSLSLLFNRGKGDLGQPITLMLSQQPTTTIAADLNGDGLLDLAVLMQDTTGSGAGSVGVFLNQGGGNFAAEVAYPAGTYPTAIAAGDVTLDGKPELLVAEGDESVLVLLNKGNGTFTNLTELQVASPDGNAPSAVTAADLNGDGLLDIVATPYGTGSVQVLYAACTK